jgi:hypothetical protein
MRKKTLSRRGLRLLLLATAISAIAAGVSYAAIPNSQTGTINGCFEKRTGFLRVIDAQAGKTCFTQYETPISWSQQGLPGSVTSILITDGPLQAEDFTTVDADGLVSANIKNDSLSGADLENDSVTSGDIMNDSLSGADLANDTVTSGDIMNDSLSGADLENDSVTSTDIQNGSLSGDDFANSSVGTAAIQANAQNAEADFPGAGMSLNGLPGAGVLRTLASATISIPSTGGAPHLVLVIGQAIVTTSGSGSVVSWGLFNGPGASSPLNPAGPPYQAEFTDTMVTPVSHVFVAPPGTHTIALKAAGHSGPPIVMNATNASLSVIDLGSI